jgi:hypothetical protein
MMTLNETPERVGAGCFIGLYNFPFFLVEVSGGAIPASATGVGWPCPERDGCRDSNPIQPTHESVVVRRGGRDSTAGLSAMTPGVAPRASTATMSSSRIGLFSLGGGVLFSPYPLATEHAPCDGLGSLPGGCSVHATYDRRAGVVGGGGASLPTTLPDFNCT